MIGQHNGQGHATWQLGDGHTPRRRRRHSCGLPTSTNYFCVKNITQSTPFHTSPIYTLLSISYVVRGHAASEHV